MMLLGHHVNSSYVYDLLIIMLSNAGILICCSYYIYKFKVLASASLFEEITFLLSNLYPSRIKTV
ncbi:hypothetical protein FSA28_0267 [Streptococcus mutans]|jgi:hypothetical protein|nr:hypothetical protein FSA28_0267 [Streptococcus mutans]